MQYRAASVVFFVVVGLLELADFAGNVITLWDDVRLRDAAEKCLGGRDGAVVLFLFAHRRFTPPFGEKGRGG